MHAAQRRERYANVDKYVPGACQDPVYHNMCHYVSLRETFHMLSLFGAQLAKKVNFRLCYTR